jgi:hypothetical protein
LFSGYTSGSVAGAAEAENPIADAIIIVFILLVTIASINVEDIIWDREIFSLSNV